MGRSASELKPAGGKSLAHHVEERVGTRVAMTRGSPRRHDLADLGILVQIDGQIAQLLVVARGDDVADVAFVANEHDAAAIDLGHLGDAADDGEEDVAKIEGRRERLGQLEHDLGVALARASASMYSRIRSCPRIASDELGGPGTACERNRRRPTRRRSRPRRRRRGRREHDHRNVAQRGARADGAEDARSRRLGHHQVEEHQRGEPARKSALGLRRRSRLGHLEVGRRSGFAEYAARRAVVVDHQDGRAFGHGSQVNPYFSISTTGAAFGSGPLGPSPCAPKTRSRHALPSPPAAAWEASPRRSVRVGLAAPISTC